MGGLVMSGPKSSATLTKSRAFAAWYRRGSIVRATTRWAISGMAAAVLLIWFWTAWAFWGDYHVVHLVGFRQMATISAGTLEYYSDVGETGGVRILQNNLDPREFSRIRLSFRLGLGMPELYPQVF